MSSPAPAVLYLPRPRTLRDLPRKPARVIRAPSAEERGQLVLTYERLRITASGCKLACLERLIASITDTGER